jgi:hypothetical protein
MMHGCRRLIGDHGCLIKDGVARDSKAGEGRTGRMWENRVKSVIVEAGVAAKTMAVYIDLNPKTEVE